MAFEELLVQERLLKPGDLLRFDGKWGTPYTDKTFRVIVAETTQRWRQVALSDAAVQTTINIDTDLGLNPQIENWAYEVRIGVGKGLYKLYTRWPINDFTRELQDPDFQINPANADLRLIGYSDFIDIPVDDPKFRWFWVKDQFPSFVLLADSGTAAIPMFQKILLRFIVNILGLEEETNPEVLAKIQSGELFISTAQHWELIGRRVSGSAG